MAAAKRALRLIGTFVGLHRGACIRGEHLLIHLRMPFPSSTIHYINALNSKDIGANLTGKRTGASLSACMHTRQRITEHRKLAKYD